MICAGANGFFMAHNTSYDARGAACNQKGGVNIAAAGL